MKQKDNSREEEAWERCKHIPNVFQFARGLDFGGRDVRMDEGLMKNINLNVKRFRKN